jgi:predicted aldo/keto reductase-like oxidoreductase
VHTLSIGAARPTDFDDHIGALAYYDRIPEVLPPIEARVRAEIARVVGADWADHWTEGIPEHYHIPGEMNVLDILRLWMFTKSLDLEVWARSRYNLLGHADHWCPGDNAGEFDEAALLAALSKSPFAARIPGILREAHALLGGEAQKRQSES